MEHKIYIKHKHSWNKHICLLKRLQGKDLGQSGFITSIKIQ